MFTVKSIDDLLVAAGIVNDTDQINISGTQLKEFAVQVSQLREDIIKCHEICTKLGSPDLGSGTIDLLKRLEWLEQK